MEYPTRIRIRLKGKLSEILVLIRHSPRDRTSLIGAALEKLSFRRNGKALADVYVGENIADDPFFSIAVGRLHSNDVVSASWHDDRGITDNVE